jgi:16S rRNA (guanine966-N2)-methyltransferase
VALIDVLREKIDRYLDIAMRIIAGEHRGRPLVPPQGQKTTRPITDKVKETVFNKLVARSLLGSTPQDEAADAPAATRVVDIFAGTGSMGLEALSRGATHCVFVERSRSALRGLGQNIDTLGLNERAEVIESDALAGAWLGAIRPRSLNVAFLDPPYDLMRRKNTRRQIVQLINTLAPKLVPAGVIVLRGPAENEAMPEPVSDLEGPVTDRFKHMAVYYYQAAPPPEGATREND